MRNPPRPLLAAAVTLACSLVVSMAGAELVIRLLYGAPLRFRAPQPRYVAASYGYKLEPNQRGFIGEAPLVANAHGFRDRPWQVPKPDDRMRILIVGDSMPFGYHVELDETFGKVLERDLHRRAPHSEVLVAAVSGWDTPTELRFLKNDGLDLDPDIVVLCLFINDFGSALPFDADGENPGGRVETRPRWSRWLSEESTLALKRSALVLFVRTRFEWAVAALYDSLRREREAGGDIETLLMRDVENAASRAAVEGVQSVIAEMNDLVTTRGGLFAIAFMPNYEIFLGGRRVPHFVSEIRAFARDRGILLIDPTEQFQKHGDVETLYLRPWDNAHFSSTGHRIVGTKLFEELLPWVQRRSPSNVASAE